MSGVSETQSMSGRPRELNAAPHPLREAAVYFIIGNVALGLVSLAAIRMGLQPGSISMLYLIVVVFVSLRAGVATSVAVSLIAGLVLNRYFRPLFSAEGTNPLPVLAELAFLVTALAITAMVERVRRLTEAQLTLQFEERLAERARIARELHDTLLQSFQALLLHFQAANDLVSPGPAKDALENALTKADLAIVEGRDAIQDLRSSTTVTNELAQAMTALGDELAGDDKGSVSFRVSIEGTPRDLHPILRDDVYRIAQEALRNAFRHAKASHIEVEISYDERYLRLRVRDDGKGISPKHLETGRDGHWGLPGMRERAQQIGAQFELWSEAGAGTEVDVRIPGAIAYGTSSGSRRFPFLRRKKEVAE